MGACLAAPLHTCSMTIIVDINFGNGGICLGEGDNYNTWGGGGGVDMSSYTPP